MDNDHRILILNFNSEILYAIFIVILILKKGLSQVFTIIDLSKRAFGQCTGSSFKACEPSAGNAENIEELIPEGLGLSAFCALTFPLAGEGECTVFYLTQRKRHKLADCSRLPKIRNIISNKA